MTKPYDNVNEEQLQEDADASLLHYVKPAMRNLPVLV